MADSAEESPVVDSATQDEDGDSWSAESGDCDDADPNVKVGATETADGVDHRYRADRAIRERVPAWERVCELWRSVAM